MSDDYARRLRIVATVAVLISPAIFMGSRLAFKRAIYSPVVAVGFSPDNGRVAAGLRNGTAQIWETKSWRRVYRSQVAGGDLNTLSFAPDSNSLAFAGRILSLWSTTPWRKARQLGSGDVDYGTARFDSSGLRLASVNSSEEIEIWDMQTGAKIRTLCCEALYGDLAFSPGGLLLASAGHWPRLWDLSTGREAHRLVSTREPTFAAVQFRSDGKLLVTGSQDGIARVWDVASGSQLLASVAREAYVETVAFRPKAPAVAYGCRDGSIWLWNLNTREERKVALTSTSNIAFNTNGGWLLFATPSVVHVRDLETDHDIAALRFRD